MSYYGERVGKFHDEDWWADKTRKGLAPVRCAGVWPYGQCRAEAIRGASCGRHGFQPDSEPYDALGLVKAGRR